MSGKGRGWESLTLNKHVPLVPAPGHTAWTLAAGEPRGSSPPRQSLTLVAARSGATGSPVRPGVT